MHAESTAPPAAPRPKSRLAARVSAIAFGLLLALGLAEFVLRVVAPGLGAPRLPLAYRADLLDRVAAGQSLYQFDVERGWVNTPGFDGRTEQEDAADASIGLRQIAAYRHNSQGLRADREYAPRPAPGVRRIAAYGDSFTYCWSINFEDCWVRRLDQQLRRTEALDFGVPGYAPDQAWLQYQQGGASWGACGVLIGHLVENINRVVNRFRPFYVPGTGEVFAKPRFILEGDQLRLLPNPARSPEDLKDPAWVERNLGPEDAWFFPNTFAASPLDFLETVRLARTAAYRRGREEGVEWQPSQAERMYRPGTEAFEVLVAVLAGFAEQVRADGATPVVVIFPWRDEIQAAAAGRPKPHAPLLEALERRGIATIDLTDALGEAARRSGLAPLVTIHYRPAGNAVVAAELARRLPRLLEPTCGPAAP